MKTTTQPTSGGGKGLAGRGLAAAAVTIIAWVWPEPGGRTWEPQIVAAMTYLGAELGGYLARWLPTPPKGRSWALLPLLLLMGCGHGGMLPGVTRVTSADDAESACIKGEGSFQWTRTDPEGSESITLAGPGCYSWSRPISDGATTLGQGVLDLIGSGTLVTAP